MEWLAFFIICPVVLYLVITSNAFDRWLRPPTEGEEQQRAHSEIEAIRQATEDSMRELAAPKINEGRLWSWRTSTRS